MLHSLLRYCQWSEKEIKGSVSKRKIFISMCKKHILTIYNYNLFLHLWMDFAHTYNEIHLKNFPTVLCCILLRTSQSMLKGLKFFRPLFGAHGLWAEKDLFRASPSVTWDHSFRGLIRRNTLYFVKFYKQSVLSALIYLPRSPWVLKTRNLE